MVASVPIAVYAQESPTTGAGMEETAKICRNCQAEVSGEYCSDCGQREGRADQRFLDLAGELTGDLFDMDSRVWRTLVALLFRPGHLSAEFIAGRRARYLPPLRLYLVISFTLFLTISLSTNNPLSERAIVPLQVSEDGLVIAVNPDDLDGNLNDIEVTEGELSSPDSNAWDGEVDLAGENSPQWLKDVDRRMEENIGALREDPRALTEAMVDYTPQMMFLLLPLFALLIQFTYLFSGFHYLQHLVFALYFHSFTYLAFLLTMGVGYAGLHMDGWVFAALLAYLPLALKRTYGSGWGGAVGKSMFIYFSYALMLIMGFAAVAMLALLML